MTTSCTPTNRIVQIRSDGIAAGAAMTFRVSRSRLAYPVAAYADKLKKKLVNYYGFGL